MRVPGGILAQVHLNQTDSRFDQSIRHEQRKAELVATITRQGPRVGPLDLEGAAGSRVVEHADRLLTMAIQTLRFRAITPSHSAVRSIQADRGGRTAAANRPRAMSESAFRK